MLILVNVFLMYYFISMFVNVYKNFEKKID